MSGTNTLTLYGDSQIDGQLVIDTGGAELVINGSVTITGKGGDIFGDGYPEEIDPVGAIRTTVSPWGTLTLECDDSGNGSEAECIVVHGALDIQANLVNNAYVIADDRDTGVRKGMLILSQNSKSGDGYWVVSTNPGLNPPGRGIMDVTVGVTGAGTWEVRDDPTVELRINAVCTGLTGDVVLTSGTMLVRENFTTTGDLTLDDVHSPEIIVRQGHIARFNVIP